jgi:hypothetical protein
MASPHSDLSPKVVGIRRIGWTACSGIGGRHVSDSLVAFRRKMQFFGKLLILQKILPIFGYYDTGSSA